MRQFWLAKKDNKKVALFPYVEKVGQASCLLFKIVGDGCEKMPDGFNPEHGTIARAVATCPVCGSVVDAKTTRKLFQEEKAGQKMIAVVLYHSKRQSKTYRIATERDVQIFREAEACLKEKREKLMAEWGMDPVPDEPLKRVPLTFGVINVWVYGMNAWGDLFNSRQKLALTTFVEKVRKVYKEMVTGSTGFQPVNVNNVKKNKDACDKENVITGKDACATIGNTGFQPVDKFNIYRRNLPHWENPGSVYFITFRTANSFTLPEQARQIVLESCRFHKGKKYDLYACVVMPDHAHLILQPLEKMAEQYYSLSEIMHSIKSYSANQINRLLNRTGTVWQDESFDRIVRDKHELMEKMNYIVNNPVKTGLVENREDYKWVYVKGWLGDDVSMVGQASRMCHIPTFQTFFMSG